MGSVSGCSFVNCSAQRGGAIFFAQMGSVSGCSFVNCNSGGGHVVAGGAICFNRNGSVSGCSFVNCSAQMGGAISCVQMGSVSGCSFVNCSAQMGGAILFFSDGSINYCIFDNNVANVAKDICGSFDGNYDFNFFSFKNDINFPKYLIGKQDASIIPNSWVVLDITRSGGEYIVKFVTDEGNNLSKSMPDYVACLTINGVSKEIFIKNNTFKDTFIEGNYVITSLNSGNVLANVTFNTTKCSMDVSVEDISYGENATVVVTLPEDATGEVTIVVYNDNGYNLTKTMDLN